MFETVDVKDVTEASLSSDLEKQTTLASHFLGRRLGAEKISNTLN